MSKPWLFVCPASRGIGFALARHLLTHTRAPLVATARTDPDGVRQRLLQDLDVDHDHDAHSPQDRLTVLKLDATDEASARAAAEAAAARFPPATHHLRAGFALPGVLGTPEKSAAQVRAEQALETFRVNAVAPMVLMKYFSGFLPRRATWRLIKDGEGDGDGKGDGDGDGDGDGFGLPPHAVWANMSARVGSVSDNRSGGWYAYRASKAAVNALTRSLDHELRARCGDAAMAVAYHPGTVRTDLSRRFWDSVPPEKLFEPDDAAAKMAGVLLGKLGLEHRGRCWDWRGDEVPP